MCFAVASSPLSFLFTWEIPSKLFLGRTAISHAALYTFHLLGFSKLSESRLLIVFRLVELFCLAQFLRSLILLCTAGSVWATSSTFIDDIAVSTMQNFEYGTASESKCIWVHFLLLTMMWGGNSLLDDISYPSCFWSSLFEKKEAKEQQRDKEFERCKGKEKQRRRRECNFYILN